MADLSDWQPPTLPVIVKYYDGPNDQFRDLFTDGPLPANAEQETLMEWFDREVVRVADRMMERSRFERRELADNLARSHMLELIFREIMKRYG